MTEGQLGARLSHVRAQIDAAALKCGRLPHEVRLIAISKTHPASLVREAIQFGATDIGENRVQEAEQKINDNIKTACKIAGINSYTETFRWQRNKKIRISGPKYEFFINTLRKKELCNDWTSIPATEVCQGFSGY